MTETQAFYEKRASGRERELGRHYHTLLRHYYRFFIPAGSRVLEVGCGFGDLLAAVEPSVGLGIDFSPGMVEGARRRHPSLRFEVGSVEMLAEEGGTFDYIILSDLINDLEDIQDVLERLQAVAHARTRLVLNFFNYLWRPVLRGAERLGWKAATPPQNWLSRVDVQNLLNLAGWDVVQMQTRILWPIRTPLLERCLNRWVAPWVAPFCLSIFGIARPRPEPNPAVQYRCSVVVPARNEAGNIRSAVERTPEMGLGTEIIFIEGHSQDETWSEVQRVQAAFPERNIQALKQQSKGKGGAVREAFAAAKGDVLFILDADLTVSPEQLPKFYEALRSGRAEFVNGVRLVYPMEEESMQFLNLIANKFFGVAFSWLLSQPVKDTLCGTKVLLRKDYETLAANRRYFGEFDPFGDFDLLFGAAKLNLKIVDLPIRYRARTYGSTNINRWRHGMLLFRMVGFAARRIKFI